MLHTRIIAACCLIMLLLCVDLQGDSIESLSGNIIEGKVISRDDKFIVLEVKIGGKDVQRKFGINLIRAITIDGKREVLVQSNPAGKPANPAGANVGPGIRRTKAEIDAIINTAGKQPPDWLKDVQLNLPKTLDLEWPDKPQGPWNNQVNIGQYIWDVINPNVHRWPEGIKLMEMMMERHKDDPATRLRAMNTMAGMYHHFFQDYARAAYWWRQTIDDKGDWIGLAECYYKLGNKPMAVDILSRLTLVPVSAIKLWGDMGEIDRAIKTVELFEKNIMVDEACLAAGDACRLAGRFPQATKYYERILALADTKDNKRSKDRARSSLDAIRYFDTFDISKVADGKYVASSLAYEGPLEVTVVVAAGKIDSVKVTKHTEKQYYASLTDTPAQIIAKQSVKGVDATSRATITSEAIINATAKALAGGK